MMLMINGGQIVCRRRRRRRLVRKHCDLQQKRNYSSLGGAAHSTPSGLSRRRLK